MLRISWAAKVAGKSQLVASILACVVTLACLGLASPSAYAESSKTLAKYALVSVVRDADGRPLMTEDGRYVSSNWSGYVLPSFKTGDTYTSVQATWIVPDVPFEKRKHDSTQWIGIGGFCADARCRKIDRTLIQIGTGQDPLGGPENVYFSWYQMSPGIPLGAPIGPNPGDVITASVSCDPCIGNQMWTLSMMDLTSGVGWKGQPVPYQSSTLSAEFVEGTSADQRQILPLANYGTIPFDQSMVNGSGANLGGGYGIVLRAPQGNSSNISPLNPTADGFTACFDQPNCTFVPIP